MTYIQHHDQIANSGNGLRVRLLTSPGRSRAMTALLILAPGTPMLFRGRAAQVWSVAEMLRCWVKTAE